MKSIDLTKEKVITLRDLAARGTGAIPRNCWSAKTP